MDKQKKEVLKYMTKLAKAQIKLNSVKTPASVKARHYTEENHLVFGLLQVVEKIPSIKITKKEFRGSMIYEWDYAGITFVEVRNNET